jgi:uncharacterized phage-associated protein
MTAEAARGLSWAPSSAVAVANYFLSLGWRDQAFPAIDQMKLQKLLFYAHAWYLAYNDRPLFAEDIEAWPWGPVVRPVYYQTRSCGKSPISNRLTELRFDPQSPLQSRFVDVDVTSQDVKEFLDRVWDVHKP